MNTHESAQPCGCDPGHRPRPWFCEWHEKERAAFDYSQLDPGIRDTVRLLRDHGFDTTDSGDGVSKPADWYASGEAMPFPHVAAKTTIGRLITEADRMLYVLGPTWIVEASYHPPQGTCLLFARKSA